MDKLVCPCCLNIHTDLGYITRTNKVCPCHPIARLNKMKIPIQSRHPGLRDGSLLDWENTVFSTAGQEKFWLMRNLLLQTCPYPSVVLLLREVKMFEMSDFTGKNGHFE